MSDDLVKQLMERASMGDVLSKEAADEIKRLRGMTEVTMGVGKGDGQLFVHGDYDSIKAAQDIMQRAEAAEARHDPFCSIHDAGTCNCFLSRQALKETSDG